jgi:hypothetical protein
MAGRAIAWITNRWKKVNREQYLSKMRAYSLPKAGLLMAVPTHEGQGEHTLPAKPIAVRPERKVKKAGRDVALAA